MGPFGVQEMIAVFIIALVLFGPKKLPELGRTLGKALTEFRRAQNELKATLQSHLNELEKETKLTETAAEKPANTVSAPYSYPYEDYALTSSAPPEEPQQQIEAAPMESTTTAG